MGNGAPGWLGEGSRGRGCDDLLFTGSVPMKGALEFEKTRHLCVTCTFVVGSDYARPTAFPRRVRLS